MDEIIINSLEYLTEKGGHFFFEKSIMYEWSKDRYIDNVDIESIKKFSINFLPIEPNYINSFVEICGDMKHFDDCTDDNIMSLILKERTVLKYHYGINAVVAFFEIKFGENKNIIIVCDSDDDRPLWFPNININKVSEIFEKPISIST